MKCVLFLLILVSVALAQFQQYAGNTTGSAIWTPPDFSSGSCVADVGDGPAPYIAINITVSSTGVYEVAAMAEEDFKYYLEIYIYSPAFNPSAPCANIIGQGLVKQFDYDGGPVLDDFIYFAVGVTYTVVITGDDGESGLFAVNIFPPSVTGAFTLSPVWYPPYQDDDGYCYTESDDYAPYGFYSWAQTTTGYFDIVFSYTNNSVDDFEYYAALYQGNIFNWTALAENPCNTTAFGGEIWDLGYSYSNGLIIPYVNLTTGFNYTVVFSGDDYDDLGYWGIQIIPTRIRFFTSVPTFNQPDRYESVPGGACVVSTDYTSAAWGATLFTAQYGVYLVDTAEPPSPFTYLDTYSFLYLGNNTGSPPSTCGYPLIIFGDTGDVTPVYADTYSGYNYTVIVSTYAGGTASPGNAYTLYTFTGIPVGIVPPTTTATVATVATVSGPTATVSGPSVTVATGTVSPAATGTTGTTGATTTKATTSSTTKAPTTTTTSGVPVSSTSSASSLVVSVFLVIATSLVAMM
jgi:hypothetical protein